MSLDLAVRYIRSITMSEDLTQHVVSTAERLEDIDEPQDLSILSTDYTVTQSGYVSEVTITVTTGGPHIEADLLSQTVSGYWAGNEHTTHYHSDMLRSFGEMLADEMEARID
jgi:hypothetical protein